MFVQQLQTGTKEYSCFITIYILVLAAEFLTGSKESTKLYRWRVGVSPKIKPSHKLLAQLSRP